MKWKFQILGGLIVAGLLTFFVGSRVQDARIAARRTVDK